jgi:hypothetical protein
VVVRRIEARLLQWPGVSREAVACERPRIEQFVDLIAEMVSAGNLSRKAFRAYLDRLESGMRQAAQVLRMTTGTPLKPYLEFLVNARSEEFDHIRSPSSFTTQAVGRLIDYLDHTANNAARLKARIPVGGGRTSMADMRNEPGADVMCAAAAIEAIGRLCGARPRRPARILWMICQAFWEAAGGKDPKAPSWNSLIKRVLRAKRESRTGWAVTMANMVVTDAINALVARMVLERS